MNLLKNKYTIYRYLYLIPIFFIYSFIGTYSQKNTEQFRSSKDIGFYHSIFAGFELTKGNEDFFKLVGSYRIDYYQSKFHTFLVGDLEYKEGNNSVISNKGFLHYRFIYQGLKHINPETFYQIEYDHFLLMEHRNLFGAGIRIDISNYADSDSSTKIDFDLGFGIMNEYEKYQINSPGYSDLVRLTNYLSMFVIFNEKSQLNLVMYFQPAVYELDDYRILAEMKLQFPIFRNFNFFTQLNYRYDNDPLPNLKYYTLGLNNGFSIQF
ncbi:MAG TPA: DUF481 domain-containing protein [Candidatus Kapabacteria bacterium]|nr:DUF481 domain-containing protein [Candidatus Kapabacteria bacterium]